MAEVPGDRARARILIEVSTEKQWVARCMEGSGREIIVADSAFSPTYATRGGRIPVLSPEFPRECLAHTVRTLVSVGRSLRKFAPTTGSWPYCGS